MNAKTGNASTSAKVADVAHEAVDRFAKSAAEAEERIRSAAADAELSIKGVTKEAKQRSRDLNQSLTDYVNEHPIKSIGMAFAAGVILSALMRR